MRAWLRVPGPLVGTSTAPLRIARSIITAIDKIVRHIDLAQSVRWSTCAAACAVLVTRLILLTAAPSHLAAAAPKVSKVWGFWSPQQTRPEKTQVARILADDPPLNLYSEKGSYMRTER
jgi:hypothetical protein